MATRQAVALASGEVDLAHAPLAQPAEDAVVAQEEAPGPAVEQLVGLVLGDQAAVDQQAGQADRIVAGQGADRSRGGGRTLLGQEAALLEVPEEGVESRASSGPPRSLHRRTAARPAEGGPVIADHVPTRPRRRAGRFNRRG